MGTRIATLALILSCISAASFADWPAYRGPQADGAVREAVFDSSGELGLKVAWQRELGSGYSSVAVAGGKALTMFSDGERDHMVAFDQATGDEQWRLDLGETYVGHDGSHTGPMSTPLVVGQRVIALGPFGRLVSASLESGEVLWSTELTKSAEAKKPHYGFSTAPLVIDGVIVVQIGAAEGGAVAGFDLETGEQRWTALEEKIDHQSPVPFPVGDRTMVMAAGGKHLSALDPRDGTVLWSYEHEGGGARGMMSLMPVLAGEERVFLAHKDNSSKVLRIGHSDDGLTLEPLWENGAIRNSYNVAVYHEGNIYAFSSRFLTCVDAETGEAHWKSRAPGDGFLMLVDGHLVIQTKDGSLHVARATPDGYQEVASLELFEELAWAPPGFADGSIYVRSLNAIARVDLVQGDSTRMAETRPGADLGGTAFGEFLASLDGAGDRQGGVDAFLAKQENFPIVEGDDLVHFVYAGEGTDLAFAGDLIGSRQEAPMVHVEGTNLHYYSARLEPDARLAYVFVRDYEELLDPRNPNKHMSTVYGRDMEMIFDPSKAIWMSWFGMPGWQAPMHVEEAQADRQGAFEARSIEVEDLEAPISLSVYLPNGYDPDAEQRYPVAYFSGGSMIQQVAKIGPTLDNLIGDRIQPIIAVFSDIPLPPSQMQKAGELFVSEVVPYVDANFKTIATRDGRAAMGAGFPGYGAMMTAFGNAELFGRVGVVSPMMMDSMRPALLEALPEPSEAPFDI